MRDDSGKDRDMQQQMNWLEADGIRSEGLQSLETAWHGWNRGGQLPSRSLFDPMAFPELLPWMLLSEITPPAPADKHSYDVMFRYLGRELERYFNAGNLTRVHLSGVGAPYTERWFAVYDRVMHRQQPHYFTGSPIGTGYEYLPLEMLILPFARTDAPQIGFVLGVFARLEFT